MLEQMKNGVYKESRISEEEYKIHAHYCREAID